MAIAAAVGFTTIAITSPASAQERSAESQRQEADSTVTEDQVRKRLDAAVANGSITQDQADRRFRGWQERQQTTSGFPSKESMDEGVNAEVQRGKLTDMQAAGIMRVYARLAMGLESGRLSVDEALAILEERSIAIHEGEQGQPSITRQDYANAQTAMQKMVDAGEITKEQMGARLARMRKMIGQSQPKVTRKDYADAQTAMQKMVDAGEITKVQMDGRLARMRKMIGRSQPQITQKDYDNAVAKMTEMVKSGEMTREQMQIRLQDMKKMMAKNSTITREDYAKAAVDMQKMVEEGKITEEQMKQRLDRMRLMIGKDKSQRQVTRQDYADAQATMQKMVEEGTITEEQMQQRLGEMRKMIGSSDDRSGISDDCMKLRLELGKAVRAGEMTREEAAEIWKNEGC
jgi:polyhydroxyalkanoate synthesis regulator phasin